MKRLTEGFNEDVSNEDYHADRQYKSSSALKLILKNPREYYKVYVENEAPTFNNKDALNIGSYTHTRILEPHLIEVEYALWTGSRRSGAKWDEFKDANEGKTIITSSQKGLVDMMISAYEKGEVVLGNHGNEKVAKLSSFFKDGKAEETLCGELDGYKVKVRTDYRKEWEDFGSINDVKTTREPVATASVEQISAICNSLGYEISAALYVDLMEKYTGKPHDFYFLFLSKADFGARLFKASEEFLERGRKKYKKAIALLKEAENTGVYFENKVEELL